MASQRVYILGGYQTDFAKNWSRKEETLFDMLKESVEGGLSAAKIDPAEVGAVVVMGLGLSFLATLYPSWRAAHTDPAEALRYE